MEIRDSLLLLSFIDFLLLFERKKFFSCYFGNISLRKNYAGKNLKLKLDAKIENFLISKRKQKYAPKELEDLHKQEKGIIILSFYCLIIIIILPFNTPRNNFISTKWAKLYIYTSVNVEFNSGQLYGNSTWLNMELSLMEVYQPQPQNLLRRVRIR